jgi:UDP-N-acetylmuramate--alanine ligase
VVFQPHRYTRTRALFDDFARSFYQADVLLVMPIYAASEKPIEGVDSRLLCESIQAHGHKDVRFVENPEVAVAALAELVTPEDVVLTLGAGNVYQVGETLLARFNA